MFNNDDEDNCPPDFGVERTIDLIVPSISSEEDRHIPVWIDKNHLCIRFHNWVGRSTADSILAEFNFINRAPQNFNHPLEVCNLVRVTEQPADTYYTTYGDTTQPQLGNWPEVEYSHPAVLTGSLDDTPSGISKTVSINFIPESTVEERRQFITRILAAYRLSTTVDIDERIAQNRQVNIFFSKTSEVGHIQLVELVRADPIVRFGSYSSLVFLEGLPEINCR